MLNRFLFHLAAVVVALVVYETAKAAYEWACRCEGCQPDPVVEEILEEAAEVCL